MPTITITRDRPLRRDRLRRYRVLIDGEPAGWIRRGTTEGFEVTPGQHVVQMRIDWCGSPPLTLEVDEEGARLTCGANYNPWSPFFIWQSVFRRNQWIYLRAEGSPEPGHTY
jgi:hypothetical protein